MSSLGLIRCEWCDKLFRRRGYLLRPALDPVWCSASCYQTAHDNVRGTFTSEETKETLWIEVAMQVYDYDPAGLLNSIFGSGK